MTNYRIRVELYCGMGTEIPMRKRMYKRAEKVAKKFHIQTYFDEHEEHGQTFVDGYIYPCTQNLEGVLTTLDEENVGYDNIDIPERIKNTPLHKRLKKRYKYGVSINPGEIEEEKC